jgi:hypothetical protein
MIAVDTNVLIYDCDQTDQRRQKIALDLITGVPDGVLLWQVACQFLSASRKLNKQGFTPTDALESPRRVPGSAAAHPADRRQSGARKGAPSCTRSVPLGCPQSRGVCRSRRRNLLLGGPARVRRFRRRTHRQPVQVAHRQRGRGGGRFSKARLAPHSPRRTSSRVAPAHVSVAASEPLKVLEALRSWRRRCSEDGRPFVPPEERPSAGVAAGMGVSDPASESPQRPRGRLARSLTPHVPVCRSDQLTITLPAHSEYDCAPFQYAGRRQTASARGRRPLRNRWVLLWHARADRSQPHAAHAAGLHRTSTRNGTRSLRPRGVHVEHVPSGWRNPVHAVAGGRRQHPVPIPSAAWWDIGPPCRGFVLLVARVTQAAPRLLGPRDAARAHEPSQAQADEHDHQNCHDGLRYDGRRPLNLAA